MLLTASTVQDKRSQARFKFLIRFWALSSHLLRVASNPLGAGKRYTTTQESVGIFRHFCIPWRQSAIERSLGIGGIQFDRSATIGSIREARHAGMYPAAAATTISSAPTPKYVIGSPEVTPNSRLPSVFDNARDAAMPKASPNAVNPNVPQKNAPLQVGR